MAPLRRAKKYLKLGPGALAILYHLSAAEDLASVDAIAHRIKHFRVKFGAPRPLSEAISSVGGIDLGEVGENLMLKKMPGVFVAGEMLDWEAPTGGFLIQGAVSLGYRAALGMDSWLKTK